MALLALVAGAPRPCFAQAGPPAQPVVLFTSGPQGERWAGKLQRELGPLDDEPVAHAAAEPPSIAPVRLRALAEVEALLLEARRLSASLHESGALVRLATAERTLEGLADVPGAAAWMAEVQLQLGAVAAQAGLTDLAEAAFRRAAALEPGRQLLPAEAAPEVVALCARIHAELALAPAGVFTVRAANPEARARAFLDDVELGALPLRARAVVGRHVLRVEAPGHRSYGSFIDVLPGERPGVVVQLTERPRLVLARSLETAVSAGRLEQVVLALRAAAAGAERAGIAAVLVAETERSGSRAVLVRCDAHGCRGPVRSEWRAAVGGVAGTPEPDAIAAARGWLQREPRSAGEGGASEPPWKRWYVWGVAGLALAAGGVALALAVRPEPERRLRVVVDPAEL